MFTIFTIVPQCVSMLTILNVKHTQSVSSVYCSDTNRYMYLLAVIVILENSLTLLRANKSSKLNIHKGCFSLTSHSTHRSISSNSTLKEACLLFVSLHENNRVTQLQL